jgi:hypothetical protein
MAVRGSAVGAFSMFHDNLRLLAQDAAGLFSIPDLADNRTEREGFLRWYYDRQIVEVSEGDLEALSLAEDSELFVRTVVRQVSMHKHNDPQLAAQAADTFWDAFECRGREVADEKERQLERGF